MNKNNEEEEKKEEDNNFVLVDINNEDINIENSNKGINNDNQKNNIKEQTIKKEESDSKHTNDSSGTKISHMDPLNKETKTKTGETKNPDKKKDEDQDSKNQHLYEYDVHELNELPLSKANEDKRSFCTYYGNILLFSHIVLNVFFIHNDYNLFVVKLGLLFMTFPINLTMNIFFFTNKNIKLTYVKSLDDISTFWRNIDNTVYSSFLSTTLLILLKLICLTHNSVRSLRQITNMKEAKEKSVCILRCIKVRITIYYILSFIFLVIFGYYVLCFCAIFENTQIELVKSTFTSWLISLIYPFIICLITSMIRSAALKCKSRFLWGIKRILQFL